MCDGGGGGGGGGFHFLIFFLLRVQKREESRYITPQVLCRLKSCTSGFESILLHVIVLLSCRFVTLFVFNVCVCSPCLSRVVSLECFGLLCIYNADL